MDKSPVKFLWLCFAPAESEKKRGEERVVLMGREEVPW